MKYNHAFAIAFSVVKHGDRSSVLSFSCCLISSKLEIRNNTGVHPNLSLTSG